MAKRKISFKKIGRSITGISTPIFGVSWTPPADERDVIRGLVTFLEDRRALYYPEHMEFGPHVSDSIMKIRTELTNILKQCSEDSEMLAPLKAMRASCRKFLDTVGPRAHASWHHEMNMWTAIGELRGVFGVHLARLCAAYGIDVPAELVEIMPASDE